MLDRLRPCTVAATLLLAGSAPALGSDLFTRNITLTPEQVARQAPPPADPAALERALVAAVMRESNARRAEAGLGPLSLDPLLAQSAGRYSRKMRDLAFFSHDAPDGESLDGRLPRGERYRYARLGENLWSGRGALDWRADSLSRQATGDWILSPSHRDNLLEPVYDVAGVGVAMGGDQVFVTMLYAKPQIDQASARLRSIYADPPADLPGFAASLEGAMLDALNGERARSARSTLAGDATLAREARFHAQASLAGGGMAAAATQGEPVMRRVLDDRANRTNRLSMLVWEASGGVTWQGRALADSALESWRKRGGTLQDVLDDGYDRAGIGVATDGTRVFATILLSETREPTVRFLSGAGPTSLLDGTPSIFPPTEYFSLD